VTEPASREPASTEPASTEPASTGPASTGPARQSPPDHALLRLPAALAEQAREVLSGRKAPATPRDAASVLLLRPAGGDRPGLEVYMLRRARSMAFAPGVFVFPGGSVDPRDAEESMAWAGPDAQEWGRALDAPPALARALVCAAVRETFEESGVLLAGPDASSVVADTSGLDWEADRQALLDHSLSLAGFLLRRALVLRSDLLRPWAHWITPVVEPRRYDTRFFAAAIPPGQLTRDVGGEAEEVAWWQPDAVIAAARQHELRLMPPTAVCLAEVGACGQVDAALGAARDLRPVIPEVVEAGDDLWLTAPRDLEYPL
jgi:8-oxo-dGTP pyrophosphatase MutT (NUDIX family)